MDALHRFRLLRLRALPRLLPYIPLIIAGGALAWIAMVVFAGGLAVRTPGLRFTSRDPLRPALVFAGAVVWYVTRFRRCWPAHAAALAALPAASITAAIAACCAVTVAVTQGTFAAAGSDASGYVSQADLWAHGQLTRPAAEWAAAAPWTNAGATAAPLGYRPSEHDGRLAPTYAPGLPLLMALFQIAAGRTAVYYVVPLLGGLAVWLTYLLGKLLWNEWAGAIAALWLATSPSFLWMVVQPMSDVPACAFWTLALVAACSRPTRPLLAGVGASAAILTRPNLAPLSLIVAALLLLRSAPATPHARLRDTWIFCAALLPAIAFVGVLNLYLHGSPLRSGYGATSDLYAAGNIVPNLRYLRWVAQSQTPLVFAGLALPFLAQRRRDAAWRERFLSAIAFPVAVLCAYLPYAVFEHWSYVRFLLPGYPPLLVGLAAAVPLLASRVGRGAASLALTAVVAGTLAWRNVDAAATYGVFGLDTVDRRYVEAAEYVKGIPDNAVIGSVNHSGSVSYYAGRDVLRWDLLEPSSLDAAIAYLERRGRVLYLVVDRPELAQYQQRFRGATALDRLVPVAAFTEGAVLFRTAPLASQ